MEILHRIGFSRLDKVDEKLDTLSIDYKKSPLPQDSYVITFDIAESDPRWAEVASLVQEKDSFDMFETVFSYEEIVNAEWVRLKPVFEHSYPQPENTWEQQTYSHICSSCGLAYDQKTPFRLKKEPRMGKHDFLSLYWAYTVFCTPKVLAAFQAGGLRGYDTWVPLVGRKKVPSQVVTQLLLPQIAGPGLVDEDKQQPEPCEACGLTKYRYHNRGYMRYRAEALHRDTDFQMTWEWFGSGTRRGFREFLISNRVARMIVAEGWRGVQLKPLELI